MGLSCHRWPGVSSGILMVFSVARVQKVQKVQRERSLRWMGLGHACGVRVDGAAPRGWWPPAGGGLCSLRSRGNGPSGRGLWYRPQGDEYKVSVTGLAFCVIRYEKHYFDQLPPVAFSPLWCLTAPPCPGGRWWHQPSHQSGNLPRPQGGCKGFIIRGRLL